MLTSAKLRRFLYCKVYFLKLNMYVCAFASQMSSFYHNYNKFQTGGNSTLPTHNEILKSPPRFGLTKVKASACNFVKKSTLAKVFSCGFCEISKSTFFTEHVRATASKRKIARNILVGNNVRKMLNACQGRRNLSLHCSEDTKDPYTTIFFQKKKSLSDRQP